MPKEEFQIIPAIDILDGKCVRLLQGKFELAEEHSINPLDVLNRWIDLGSKRIHIIDLNGAKEGYLVNFSLISELVKVALSSNVVIQVGGGIRTHDSVRKYLDQGVSYIILSTRIFKDLAFFKSVKGLYGSNLIIGLDLKATKLALGGWKEEVNISLENFAKELTLEDQVVYTNVSRDGTLGGVDLSAVSKIAGLFGSKIIISGGISTIQDIISILRLKKEKYNNIVGVVLGKSLYKGTVDLKLAIEEVERSLKRSN